MWLGCKSIFPTELDRLAGCGVNNCLRNRRLNAKVVLRARYIIKYSLITRTGQSSWDYMDASNFSDDARTIRQTRKWAAEPVSR